MDGKRRLGFNPNSGLIDRKFTKEWSQSGYINMDKVPDVVQSLITQRHSMIDYIELLHDNIDKLIIENNICNCPSCDVDGCTAGND